MDAALGDQTWHSFMGVATLGSQWLVCSRTMAHFEYSMERRCCRSSKNGYQSIKVAWMGAARPPRPPEESLAVFSALSIHHKELDARWEKGPLPSENLQDYGQ